MVTGRIMADGGGTADGGGDEGWTIRSRRLRENPEVTVLVVAVDGDDEVLLVVANASFLNFSH